MVDPEMIRARYARLSADLDERSRRLFAASEARAAGYGGIVAGSQATGIAPSTIGRGLKELASTALLDAERIGRPGGGRKSLVAADASLLDDLLARVSPSERGDPMSPLRWTCKSRRRLAGELADRGHQISHTLVGELLKAQKFSLQAHRKTREGDSHPDRDAQFTYIGGSVTTALAAGQPVFSVDTKKQELVGDFKNAGREWRPQGEPEEVRVHDVLIKELGRAVPYGIYDLAANAGWVSVGMDHDTAAFAVQTIRRWWHDIGARRYPEAKRLTITADGGGSNGSRVRLWKRELQTLVLRCNQMLQHPVAGSQHQRVAGGPTVQTFAEANVCVGPLVLRCNQMLQHPVAESQHQPMNSASRSPCTTFRRAPASGTRSSTGCSRSSA